MPRRALLDRHLGVLIGLLLAVVALAPVLVSRGYVLIGDMVFVPRAPMDRSLLGVSAAVPRAVPSDLLAAVLSHVVPGDIAQRLLLVAVFVIAASGGARLLRGCSVGARAVAAVVLAWNPYVAERLALGQWAILLGYAALPWVVIAAGRLRAGEQAWAALVLSLALAALTPTSGLVAGATALLIAGGRRVAGVAGVWLVLDLPWLLPALLRPGGLPAAPEGVAAFAARADTPLGVLGSVLSLGGIWNAGAVPPGRDAAGLVPITLLLLAAVVWGVVLLLRDGTPALPRGAAIGLVVAAGGSVLLALAGATPGLQTLLRDLVEHVSAAGLLRDGTRHLGPLAVLEAVALGLAAQALVDRLPGWRVPVAALAVVVPVLLLPGLIGGVSGRLHPVDYPAAWAHARAEVSADRTPGSLLVLPWSTYRAPPWNRRRTVLDPAGKAFDRRVVADDRLRVGTRIVPGEDRLAARLTPLAEGTEPLVAAAQAAGVRWVLVERDVPQARLVELRLAGATQVVDAPELSLWRLPAPAPLTERTPPFGVIVVADVAAALLVLGALLVWVRERSARRE